MLIVCLSLPAQSQIQPAPIDANAHERVKALYENLHAGIGTGIFFGHQDALAYGVQWKTGHNRSDIKDVCGAYPAVFGWDVSKLGQRPFNIDTVDFEQMREWIAFAYKQGGINTISWHMDNPATGGDSWDNRPAVKAILPGGEKHDFYREKLDLFAAFVGSLKAGGQPIPIIFRPFHEHTGGWFWWGNKSCTPEEYKALWHFTVQYLRDEKEVHNLLYAYSTDVFDSEAAYLERYPGDEYIDILGFDDYHSIKTGANAAVLTRRCRELVRMARERGKIAALTETGVETIPDSNWWTGVLLKRLKADPEASRIAYIMVWRNARLNHHYGPFAGHASAADFQAFYRDPLTLFAGDRKRLYKTRKNPNLPE